MIMNDHRFQKPLKIANLNRDKPLLKKVTKVVTCSSLLKERHMQQRFSTKEKRQRSSRITKQVIILVSLHYFVMSQEQLM